MEKTLQEGSKAQCILLAAEQVFSRKGYTKATLDEIIKIADTGKGTVYKYYQNKDNLFYTLIKSKHEILLQDLRAACGEALPFVTRLHNFITTFLSFIEQNHVLWQVLIFETMGSTAGWKVMWNSEKTDFDVVVLWGEAPTQDEVEHKKRYARLLKEEIGFLETILLKGIQDGLLKEMDDISLVATNIFFSNIMIVSQKREGNLDTKAIAVNICDRFMHGQQK